jgi:hypothetical protein
MNERIRELEDQASQYASRETTNLDEWEFIFRKKFAELIVQECAEWIVDNADSMEHLGPAFFAKAMKTEFGVEL